MFPSAPSRAIRYDGMALHQPEVIEFSRPATNDVRAGDHVIEQATLASQARTRSLNIGCSPGLAPLLGRCARLLFCKLSPAWCFTPKRSPQLRSDVWTRADAAEQKQDNQHDHKKANDATKPTPAIIALAVSPVTATAEQQHKNQDDEKEGHRA
jgi:hypothetical protein